MTFLKNYVLRILLFAFVLVPLSASADHSWNGYHWARQSSPFTLLVVNSVTAGWADEFNQTLLDWGASEVLDLEVASSNDDRKIRKRCPMVDGQIRVCDADYGQNGWLGLATIGLDANGHIDRGSAKMNDSYDWYFTAEEMNHVMCQEVGHLFGLGHTSEDGSSQGTCMDYSSDPASQWPNDHDYEELALIYGHTDSYDSYDTGNSGGGSSGGGVCNAPQGKGCNKAQLLAEVPPMGFRIHRGRNYEIWVASRSDGGLWIHHVYLAPGSEFDPAH